MSRIPIRLPAKSKYHAKRTDGYASKKEAKRAAELELLVKVGHISNLRKQVSYIVVPKDDLGPAVSYRADFEYYDEGWGHRVIEDVKGFRTEVYKLKRRLMYSVHGIIVSEV